VRLLRLPAPTLFHPLARAVTGPLSRALTGPLGGVTGRAAAAVERATGEGHGAAVLLRAGVVGSARPDRALRAGAAVLFWGPTVAGGYVACAARDPDGVAVLDDDGPVTFAELDARSTRIAVALRARGLGGGASVALLCRNSRHPVEALVALSKAGADVLLLNTGLSPGQVRDIVAREAATAVVVDSDLADLLAEVPGDVLRVTGHGAGDLTLDDLCAEAADAAAERLSRPERPGRIVVLTSGTTGTPKGAVRSEPRSLAPAAALLTRIPYRSRRVTLVAAPLFHTWGFANLQAATALGSTLLLQRRFDPATVLRALTEQSVDTLIAVPVMLARLLDAGAPPAPPPMLRIVAVSGSALPGPLATRFMDAFGDVLYNLYGSTEVSWATIATPAELRASPGTSGRPPRGTRLALLDAAGEPVAAGETGRVFVGNGLLFEGYTGGAEAKEQRDGLMATGDVGRLDADGLLHLAGRDDDMIVSGGENVFPREVEDVLAGEAEVAEVAVVGVDDEEFGQRLAAYVVLRTGATLSEEEVRARVRGRLARFSVPRDVVFLDELPRNATGKVVPRELPPSQG